MDSMKGAEPHSPSPRALRSRHPHPLKTEGAVNGICGGLEFIKTISNQNCTLLVFIADKTDL